MTGPAEPTPAPPEMLTTTQAARELNVHPKTIRRWASEGRIAAVRLPGRQPPSEAGQRPLAERRHLRIARAEVDRLLGRAEDPPPADETPPASDRGPA